jgi:3-hydroxyisobutyrate dehydrogenase-like beta-hydroxyacid dehydrogenase
LPIGRSLLRAIPVASSPSTGPWFRQPLTEPSHNHDFTPGGRIRFHHKDLGIALEASRMYGVSLPVTALVDQVFASLVSRGRGDLDHSALLTYLEDLAAHRVG